LVDKLPPEEASLQVVSTIDSKLRTWAEPAQLPDFRVPAGRSPRGGLVRAKHCDPGDFPAELAAEWFLDAFTTWHRDPRNRKRPRVTWRCPWCRNMNQRRLVREALRGASRASGLGPPIWPEVVLHLADDSDLFPVFAKPRPPGARPWAPLPWAPENDETRFGIPAAREDRRFGGMATG
jgi:hypothetical protein